MADFGQHPVDLGDVETQSVAVDFEDLAPHQSTGDPYRWLHSTGCEQARRRTQSI